MKKNQDTIIPAIFISLTILVIAGCTSFLNKKPGPEQLYDQPIIDIAYCKFNLPSKLCIASLGVENGNKTLVNFTTTDPSFPDFDLKVQRDGNQSNYECQRVEGFPTSIYCIGEKISLGDTIEMEVFSKTEKYLIAKGNLNISFLALSTPITVLTTKISITSSTLQATPSQVSTPGGTPTTTVRATPSATGTAVDSYPNSSYP